MKEYYETILGADSEDRFSKLFRVDPGKVVLVSSINFACPETDDVGEVIQDGDCAILHKVEVSTAGIPEIDDTCTECASCVLFDLESHITSTEPVVQCGELWTVNANNNLSVLSVPGLYQFELCNENAIGRAVIKVMELPYKEAMLLPKPLYYGEC